MYVYNTHVMCQPAGTYFILCTPRAVPMYICTALWLFNTLLIKQYNQDLYTIGMWLLWLIAQIITHATVVYGLPIIIETLQGRLEHTCAAQRIVQCASTLSRLYRECRTVLLLVQPPGLDSQQAHSPFQCQCHCWFIHPFQRSLLLLHERGIRDSCMSVKRSLDVDNNEAQSQQPPSNCFIINKLKHLPLVIIPCFSGTHAFSGSRDYKPATSLVLATHASTCSMVYILWACGTIAQPICRDDLETRWRLQSIT